MNPIIKSNNLLNNAMAMQQANRHDAEEALMCNYRGELSECSQSNFFLVRDGSVLTPQTAAGLLEGITRAFIFELGQEQGIEVREATLLPADLDSAQEVFITSTTRELSPVTRIDQRVIGSGKPGSLTLQLLKAYRRRAWESTKRVDCRTVDAYSAREGLDRRTRADQVAIAVRVVDACDARPELRLAQRTATDTPPARASTGGSTYRTSLLQPCAGHS